ENKPARGASKTVCGTGYSDRERFRRFSENRPRRRCCRLEGRADSRRVSGSQSQGSKCAQRLCSVAGAGETSEDLARFRAGRRKIQALPYPNRTSRSSAAKNSRDRHGAIKNGTGSFCRRRKKNRSKQAAD